MDYDDLDHVRRTGRPRRGPRDGNDRTARIARFLSANRTKRPAMATELVLSAAATGSEPDVLARWEKDHVGPELAAEINALIEDYASDQGTTVAATLAWCREDGSPHLSKGFRATCREEDQENVRPLDGGMQSLLSQCQRHLEATQQMHIVREGRMDERWERVMALYEGTIEKLTDKLVERDNQLEASKEETERATDLAQEAIERAEAAEAAAAEAEGADAMGKVVEIATKQLMSGGGPSKPTP